MSLSHWHDHRDRLVAELSGSRDGKQELQRLQAQLQAEAVDREQLQKEVSKLQSQIVKSAHDYRGVVDLNNTLLEEKVRSVRLPNN